MTQTIDVTKPLLPWSVVETDDYQWARDKAAQETGWRSWKFMRTRVVKQTFAAAKMAACYIATYETKPIDPALKAAREWLIGRMMNEDTIEKVRLGEWDNLAQVKGFIAGYNRALEERGE